MPVVEVDGTVVEDGSDDSADNAAPDDTVTIVTMALTSGKRPAGEKEILNEKDSRNHGQLL
jgi:hypothetical protein